MKSLDLIKEAKAVVDEAYKTVKAVSKEEAEGYKKNLKQKALWLH